MFAVMRSPQRRNFSPSSQAASSSFWSPIFFNTGAYGFALLWLLLLWALVLGVMAVYSHRANIVRLIGNRENKLDFAKITEISRKGKKKD